LVAYRQNKLEEAQNNSASRTRHSGLVGNMRNCSALEYSSLGQAIDDIPVVVAPFLSVIWRASTQLVAI